MIVNTGNEGGIEGRLPTMLCITLCLVNKVPPKTRASLAMNREKATRALCLELGVQPEDAAVSLKAAAEAIYKIIPQRKADAMTQTELFEKAGIITKTTGQKALAELLAAGTFERLGKGGPHDLYRYWRGQK